jgi:glycosyltransferase involved in cell wall biosynthesis
LARRSGFAIWRCRQLARFLPILKTPQLGVERKFKLTHVGFILPLESKWMGGQTYMFNLVSSYLDSQKSSSNNHKISILFASEQVPPEFTDFDQDQRVALVACPELMKLRTLSGLSQLLLLGQIPVVSDKFRALGLTVVFSPTIYLGKLSSQKVVTWLPDLQHRALPRFFSTRQRLLREVSYRLCIRSSDRLMLSSADAEQMFMKYYGRQFEHKVNIVPFTPSIEPLSRADVFDVLKRYRLEPGFLFLPNQFWAHKNHSVAVSALEVLCQENWAGCLVMTGELPKRSNARQSNALLDRISRLQSSGKLRCFGNVPPRDFLALLQPSGCLVNPSRFEGRSSTVEEAIAYGIPMILSDLAIHREQAGTKTIYFGLDDADALTKAMRRTYPALVRTRLAPMAKDRSRFFSQALVRVLHFGDLTGLSQHRTG